MSQANHWGVENMKIDITAETRTGREYVGEFEFPAVPSQGNEITVLVRGKSAWGDFDQAFQTTYEVRGVCWSVDRDEEDRMASVSMLVREIDRGEV